MRRKRREKHIVREPIAIATEGDRQTRLDVPFPVLSLLATTNAAARANSQIPNSRYKYRPETRYTLLERGHLRPQKWTASAVISIDSVVMGVPRVLA